MARNKSLAWFARSASALARSASARWVFQAIDVDQRQGRTVDSVPVCIRPKLTLWAAAPPSEHAHAAHDWRH